MTASNACGRDHDQHATCSPCAEIVARLDALRASHRPNRGARALGSFRLQAGDRRSRRGRASQDDAS